MRATPLFQQGCFRPQEERGLSFSPIQAKRESVPALPIPRDVLANAVSENHRLRPGEKSLLSHFRRPYGHDLSRHPGS
jgi:hypothetical protein